MKDIELFNDHFQNYKVYGIPKAQLVIADIPYNVGDDAYGSNPLWYKGGDNKNGESELAGKKQRAKLGKRYFYQPSAELDKIPQMLEGLGIHDYHLDNIIEMRVRPIIMNAEYVG